MAMLLLAHGGLLASLTNLTHGRVGQACGQHLPARPLSRGRGPASATRTTWLDRILKRRNNFLVT